MTKKVTVLIVDDDDWLREQYERVLKTVGFLVAHAPHALAAIELLDTTKPDVVVLDLFLAGPNAFTLLHEMRSHEDLASIPVILCTNSAGDIAAEDTLFYGVHRVLDKTTMQPDDLVAAIKKVLLYEQ